MEHIQFRNIPCHKFWTWEIVNHPFFVLLFNFFSNCFYYTVFSLLFSRLQDRKVNKSKKKNSYLLNVPFFSLFFPHSDLLTTNWKARFTQITISFVDCRSDTYKKVLFYLCNIRHCQRGGIYWTKKITSGQWFSLMWLIESRKEKKKKERKKRFCTSFLNVPGSPYKLYFFVW